jgi:hypothetical protein
MQKAPIEEAVSDGEAAEGCRVPMRMATRVVESAHAEPLNTQGALSVMPWTPQ